MPVVRKMSEMRIGEGCFVDSVLHTGAMQKKLTDLGLAKGTYVVCEMISAHGDMYAFSVRGACIALRVGDLAYIYVTAK